MGWLERAGVERRERLIVIGAILVAVALSVAFALLRRHHPLVGDAPEYDAEGRFIADGHLWWSALPFGVPHATAWKAPLYPAWVGALYAVLGEHHVRVELVQSVVLAPLTVGLAWWLGRRLLGPRGGMAVALVAAVYPALWQWNGLLYSETLAIPLTLLLLTVVVDREPTGRRAAAAGALLGVNLLVRPSAIALLAGVVVAWVVTTGWRRGAALSALTLLVAVLVVAPWTIRNAVVLDGFLPVSLQDAAAYGTFNDDAANDPKAPYAWRAVPRSVLGVYDRRHPVPDLTFRARLQQLAFDYVKQHPASVSKAFFWNGLTRTWDIRRPSHILAEPKFDGRSRAVTAVGMAMWWVLLPLALLGLWRLRRRRALVWPVLAIAVASTLLLTVESETRYRAPLETLVVVLACAGLPWLTRERSRPPGSRPTTAPGRRGPADPRDDTSPRTV